MTEIRLVQESYTQLTVATEYKGYEISLVFDREDEKLFLLHVFNAQQVQINVAVEDNAALRAFIDEVVREVQEKYLVPRIERESKYKEN